MRNRIIFVFLLVLLPLSAFAGDVELSGMTRSYIGSRFSEADVPVLEQTVDISLQGWADKSGILVNPYAYIDGTGDLELGVREAYVDLYFPSLDIRLGKQAIVWGEAEGAFITDIVSPQDLRSFILSDFREVRIGVAALKADYFLGPLTFEAVWLPQFVPTKLPDAGSIWRIDAMPVIDSANVPGFSLENGEFFGKVSYFGSALNAELMAGYAWDDMPVLTGPKPTAPGDPPPQVGFERLTIVGGSLSTTVASVVLRTEAAAYLDRGFTAMVSPGVFGTIYQHQLHALGGVDWSILGIDMSAQYIVQYIFDRDPRLMADEVEHTATFRARDSFFSDTLTVQLFGYFGFDPYDALLRPSVSWSIEDGVELEAGTEIFVGDNAGSFGRYSDNTMAYLSLRWYF